MTLQDRDLERALALLADDVSLAREDVDAAYSVFAQRLARATVRRRRQRLVAACAAAVLCVGGAAAYLAGSHHGKDLLQPAKRSTSTSQASVISAADLVGVWQMHAEWASAPGSLWTFYADGSGGYSNNANVLEVPMQYSLRGAGLGMHDVTGCGFSYHLTQYSVGTLTAEVRDHCGNNGPGMSWVRLSPASSAGKAIPMPSMTGATPVRTLAQVGGVWLMPGTGMLVAIDTRDPAHVTYSLDDRGDLARGPRDSGVVTLGPSGVLTLASSKPAPAGCSASSGPRITLSDVRVVAGKGIEARSGVSSTCAPAPVQESWIMVSAR
jgi:hypothetical protein